MAICKKAGFSLGTAVVLDAFITGGSVSLTGLGVSGICQSLSNAGVNVFAGLCTYHLTKEKDGNSDRQIGNAFQLAVEQTLESVKNDFIKENKMDVSWWRAQSFKYGFDIPSFDDNYTLQNSLDRHFFQPLFRLLGDEKAIAEILAANQELNPSDFIKKLIEKEKIELPEFRKEHQEGLIKALVDGFNDRFRFHLIKNLLKDERARKAYQIQLLQTSITYLSRIDRKVDDLLDFVKSHRISLLEVDESINRRQTELTNEFHKLQSEFLHQFSLKLVTYRIKKYDIRDQFRFDSLFTTFQGRANELDQLSDFLYADSMFSFYAISGPGGAGKSRLANELCLKAETWRWISGFCDQDSNRTFNWDSFRPNTQTLIVFDYILGRKEEIAKILDILSYQAEHRNFKHKVRVLLLDREFSEELRRTIFTSKTRTHYFTYSLNEEEKPLQLEEMDEDARWGIIEQVVKDLDDEDEINKILSRKSSILMELDRQDPEKRPLFTFFTAVALREGASIAGWNTHDNLKYHLQHLEDKVWSQVPIWQDESLRTPLRHLIWLTAICEYLTFEDMEMIKELGPFKRLADHWDEESFWVQLSSLFRMESVGAPEANFPGLKPDLLAEFYIQTHLSKILEKPMLHAHLPILYRLAWDLRSSHVWGMSSLTITNYMDDTSSGLHHYLEWMSNATDLDNKYAGMLFFNLAHHHQELSDLDKAKQYFIKAIEHGEVGAFNSLANLYQNQGLMKEAEEQYLRAIKEDNVYALNNLAILYREMNQKEEAERYYLQAIEKGHVQAIYNLAIYYEDMDREEEAKKYYLKAIHDGYNLALNNLGVLYGRQNRLKEAEYYLLKAIEYGSAGALNNLGIVYGRWGRLVEAEHYFLQAIEEGEKNALLNLADLYYIQKRFQEAEHLRRLPIQGEFNGK